MHLEFVIFRKSDSKSLDFLVFVEVIILSILNSSTVRHCSTLYLDWLIDGSKLAPQILWVDFMVRITQFTSYRSIRRRGYNVEWYTIAFQVTLYIAICFFFYFNALENMSLEIVSLRGRLKFQYATVIWFEK